MDEIVTSRVPSEVRRQGSAILKKIGATQTQLVNSAYDYLIHHGMTEYCSAGLLHSEIHGSAPICGSPWLIAAYHVFLRLLVPRHSPCALLSLTFVSILGSLKFGYL